MKEIFDAIHKGAMAFLKKEEISMDDIITVRVKNILGTEETDEKIRAGATVGKLLQQAAPNLQINPQGAVLMYQGQQLPPEESLFSVGVRDGDAVMMAPGSIVGGDVDPLTELVYESCD